MNLSIRGLPIVYEDESVIVVDKPSGLLSQPGREVTDSVLTRVMEARPDAHGPLLVHRLDMDTSGLMLLAKSRSAHRDLQQQFQHRRIGKRYVARLIRIPDALGGRIHLPLRLDIDDRPRQVVCAEHGKESTTFWHRILNADPHCIYLYPMTGRTHQLRVHLAHPSGLGIGIQGDRLYPTRRDRTHAVHVTDAANAALNDQLTESAVLNSRLMLHAQVLAFDHPESGARQCLQSAASLLDFGYKAI